MAQIGRSWSLFGICVFLVAMIMAPVFTLESFSWISTPMVEMAAHQVPNAWIMRVGFISLGIGILLDTMHTVNRYDLHDLPFLLFAVLMIAGGAVNLQTASASDFVASPIAHAKGFLFIFAFLSVLTGIFIRIFFSPAGFERIASIVVVALLILLPLTLAVAPQCTGLVDRMIYLLMVGWIAWFVPPRHAKAN